MRPFLSVTTSGLAPFNGDPWILPAALSSSALSVSPASSSAEVLEAAVQEPPETAPVGSSEPPSRTSI